MDRCSQQKDDGSCEGCALHEQTEPEVTADDVKIQWILEQVRHKLLVMSGKGGVGKTSVAVALALILARRGFAVGLVDVDLHGPDVFRMLGLGAPLDLFHAQHNLPADVFKNLKIISIEAMMKDRDAAVIWRGPIKHKIFRHFLTEIEWGPLDFLIIDSPPGTGDEPLSVARTIPEAKAVIVTTPQEISLADVRKSINFCSKVDMRILGVIENMGHVVCPHCGKQVPLFASTGGSQALQSLGQNLLGALPFDPQVVEAADDGRLMAVDASKSPFFIAFQKVSDSILAALGEPEPLAPSRQREAGAMKFAIPVEAGKLSLQFGQNQSFSLIAVKDSQIVSQEEAVPPDFKEGLLPAWLDRQGVTHLIVADLGEKAKKFFARKGIEVSLGSPDLSPEALVQHYLASHSSPTGSG